MLLLSCSTVATKDPRTAQVITDALDDSIKSHEKKQAVTATPETINQALLPKIQLDLPAQTGIDVEPRFDIKVNQTPAREFFIGLVAGTTYNMVVHPNVKGRITLDLKNVSINEVMDVVKDAYGFDYEKTHTAYHVYPNAIRSKIFKVDYLAIKRAGGIEEKASSNLRQSGHQS